MKLLIKLGQDSQENWILEVYTSESECQSFEITDEIAQKFIDAGVEY